jgi:SnoaL-like domain
MTTNISIPPPFATYAKAVNNRDAATMYTCFSANAIVTDEGHVYNNLEAIRQWCIQTLNQYQFTIDVTGVLVEGKETIVTADVSGSFPGSPVTLRFFLSIENDKIATLNIRN